MNHLLTILLTMTIPFLAAQKGCGREDSLSERVQKEGATLEVKTANWAEYPYVPEVKATLAHDDEMLYCLFDVNEKHLLVKTLENNGPVWEDSCVEIFIADPDGKHYYNFETNAAGVGLASRRESRENFERFNEKEMGEIIRQSSLEKKTYDEKDADGIHWTLLVGIPFRLIGYDKAPESLRMNIYKCGDATETPHFVSWAPINVETPDFHRPEFFQEVKLAK